VPERASQLREALAFRPAVGKMHDKFAAKLLREPPGEQLGGVAGRKMAELAPVAVTHDPVFEAVVRSNMNGGDEQSPSIEAAEPSSRWNEC
jgi:hypothetical protein